jgi:hypothetical protein
LPDFVDQRLSRVAELEVDGPELLGLRHIYGPLDQLADDGVDLGLECFQDGFDTLFARLVRIGGKGMTRHRWLPVVKNRGGFQPT